MMEVLGEPSQCEVDAALNSDHTGEVLAPAAVEPALAQEPGAARHPPVRLVMKVLHLTCNSVGLEDGRKLAVAVELWLLRRGQDEGGAPHALGELVLGLALVELPAHLAARVAPHARLHALRVLARLGDRPRAPAKADAACARDALAVEVRVDALEDRAAPGPIEPLQPLLALVRRTILVVRLDAPPLVKIRTHDVVAARGERVAQRSVVPAVEAKDVVHDDDGGLPARVASSVTTTSSPEVDGFPRGSEGRTLFGVTRREGARRAAARHEEMEGPFLASVATMPRSRSQCERRGVF
mmetsp:Transcript_2101/g.5710  ORF Transcript_2101/g.5710 Transcript_2101/m.5710 type:complete len:297 (-) Transcript_2101:1218-2108(-)